MKKYITLIGFVTTATLVLADPFSLNPRLKTVSQLAKETQNILIVTCSASRQPFVVNDNYQFDINVVSVLKGDAKPGPSRLMAYYGPKEGEALLVFSDQYRNDEHFTGYEGRGANRIVPIDRGLSITNDLSGKSLLEQIQYIFATRLHTLNTATPKAQEEIKRLEDALKEKAPPEQ